MTTIGFYGPGNMGEHLIKCIHNHSKHLYVYHRRDERSEELAHKYNLNKSTLSEICKMDILILCVKPSHYLKVTESIGPELSKHTLVVSVLAGIPLGRIRSDLNTPNVVRIMTTLVIPENGKGIVFTFGSDDCSTHLDHLKEFFRLVEMDSDDSMDRITSIYGCGPAFVAEFFNIYTKIMIQNFPKFSESQSREIVQELFVNSIHSMSDPSELIQKVACKDGATECALKVIENSDIFKTMDQTVDTAYQKACKLRRAYS